MFSLKGSVFTGFFLYGYCKNSLFETAAKNKNASIFFLINILRCMFSELYLAMFESFAALDNLRRVYPFNQFGLFGDATVPTV